MQTWVHTLSCCAPRCTCTVDGFSCDSVEVICPTHYETASASARLRKASTERRLTWLQEKWDDQDFFEAAVAKGYYLKFCNLIAWATDNDEAAWQRIKREVIAANQDPVPQRSNVLFLDDYRRSSSSGSTQHH